MSSDDIKWAWTDTFMRWLTGCAVLLCGVGFVAPSISLDSGEVNAWAMVVGLFLSAGCALCLLLSNASAANAQLYFSTGRWASGIGAAVVFIGGGAVSMTSMHTGWTVFSGWAAGYPLPSDEHMSWAFGFIAYVKPVVNWNIQALKDIKAERAMAEHERAKQEAFDREQREINRQTPANRTKSPAKSPADRQTGEIVQLRPVDRPADRPPQPVETTADRTVVEKSPGQMVEELPALESPAHSAETFADAASHARHLITVESVRHRNELVRRVRGLSTYRATQLLDELAPDWRTKKSAAA